MRLNHLPRRVVDQVHVVEIGGEPERPAVARAGVRVDAAAHLRAVEREVGERLRPWAR